MLALVFWACCTHSESSREKGFVDALPEGMGILNVDVPDPPPRARVEITYTSKPWLPSVYARFPFQAILWLNEPIRVEASAPGYKGLNLEVLLSNQERLLTTTFAFSEDRGTTFRHLNYLPQDIPEYTGFERCHPPVVGKPTRIVFAAWGKDEETASNLVDEDGGVWEHWWFYNRDQPIRRIGRVDPALFSYMVGLIDETASSEMISLHYICEDCGNRDLLMFPPMSPERRPIVMASVGQVTERRHGVAADELVAWFLGLLLDIEPQGPWDR